MNIPTVTKGMILAFGRNALSYVAGAITIVASLHIVSETDANHLTTALGQLGTGLATAAGSLATIASVGAGIYASFKATPVEQAKSITTSLPGTRVLTTKAIADATPNHPNIVATYVNNPYGKS